MDMVYCFQNTKNREKNMNINKYIGVKAKVLGGFVVAFSFAATMVAADIAALGSTARGGTSQVGLLWRQRFQTLANFRCVLRS